MPHKIPQQQRPQLHCSKSLKYYTKSSYSQNCTYKAHTLGTEQTGLSGNDCNNVL